MRLKNPLFAPRSFVIMPNLWSLMLSKVILQGYILISDADLEKVKTELIVHSKLTKEELGCLVFEVWPDINNANKFHVYEEFIDQDAFDNHQARVKNSNWAKVTTQVQRHYQIN
tara:strand:- start:1940 stop:2281 length:342 start_codon:yes stop_codon:yes gene_type:complete